MENFVLKEVYEEYAKRVEEENNRQNHRISILENSLTQIVQIASAVERLATNMEHMAKEQQMQGERLKTLEDRDGEMWRKVVSYVVTGFLSALIGFIVSRLGM